MLRRELLREAFHVVPRAPGRSLRARGGGGVSSGSTGSVPHQSGAPPKGVLYVATPPPVDVPGKPVSLHLPRQKIDKVRRVFAGEFCMCSFQLYSIHHET